MKNEVGWNHYLGKVSVPNLDFHMQKECQIGMVTILRNAKILGDFSRTPFYVL